MRSRYLLTLLAFLIFSPRGESQEIIPMASATKHTPAEKEEARANLNKWRAILEDGGKSDYVISESGYLLADIDSTRGKLKWIYLGDRDAISQDVIPAGQAYRARLVTNGDTEAKQTTIPPAAKDRAIIIGEKPGKVAVAIVANGKDGAEPDEVRNVTIAIEPLKPKTPPVPQPGDIVSDDALVQAALADVKAGKGTLFQAMKMSAFYGQIARTIGKTEVFGTFGDFFKALEDVGEAMSGGKPGDALPTLRAAVAKIVTDEVGGKMSQQLTAADRAKLEATFKKIAERLAVIK